MTTPEIALDPPLDEALLQRFLHLSYVDWQPPEVERPAFDHFVATEPAVPRWCAGWGRPGDHAALATIGGAPAGLAWCRLLTADDSGHSFVSERIPCLAIAVEPAARGTGVGGALLDALAVCLAERGYAALTLAVELENRARRLYGRHGFVEEAEAGGYLRMRRALRG
jgi:ribosomal protein S18 acetylase RimI-like enzyme